MAFTIDTKLLEQRLLTRETVIGGTSLSRCAARLQQLFHNRDKEQASAALEAVNRDFQLYQLEMGKTNQIYDMCGKEISEYEALGREIGERVQQVEDSISRLSVELQQQQRLRRHRQECEMLSKVVNTLPSVSAAQGAIDVVEEQIQRIQEQLAAKEACEQLRKKQFGLLMTSLYDLQKSLAEDSYLVQCQQQLDATLAAEEEEGAVVGGEGDEEEEEVAERRAERGGDMDEEPTRKKARLTEEPNSEENGATENEDSTSLKPLEGETEHMDVVAAPATAMEEGEEEETPAAKQTSSTTAE